MKLIKRVFWCHNVVIDYELRCSTSFKIQPCREIFTGWFLPVIVDTKGKN